MCHPPIHRFVLSCLSDSSRPATFFARVVFRTQGRLQQHMCSLSHCCDVSVASEVLQMQVWDVNVAILLVILPWNFPMAAVLCNPRLIDSGYPTSPWPSRRPSALLLTDQLHKNTVSARCCPHCSVFSNTHRALHHPRPEHSSSICELPCMLPPVSAACCVGNTLTSPFHWSEHSDAGRKVQVLTQSSQSTPLLFVRISLSASQTLYSVCYVVAVLRRKMLRCEQDTHTGHDTFHQTLLEDGIDF